MDGGAMWNGAACGVAGQICDPGVTRWYALRVAPQREDQAEAWLAARDVYAFHPVKLRRVVRRGVARIYQRRYLPGYVFARFRGDAICHEVLRCPFITGAVKRDGGEWGILDPAALRKLHHMRAMDQAQADARAEQILRRRRQAEMRPGEAVMFRSGPLRDFPGQVVSLSAEGGAEVRITIFGRDELVQVKKSVLRRMGAHR